MHPAPALVYGHTSVYANSRPKSGLVTIPSWTVQEITKAVSVELGDVIQHLWSGYGVIQRAVLHGLEHEGGQTNGYPW